MSTTRMSHSFMGAVAALVALVAAMAVARGTVRGFSEEKGYGFISPDEGGEDIFVHYTDIEGEGFRSLHEGERVSYEAAASSSGARRRQEAKEVSRILG